jgi:hypothetical protein
MKVEELIRQLGDADARKRASAARRLGQLGDPQAVLPLMERLSDSRREVCAAALEALQELGEGRLAQALYNALEGSPTAVHQLADLAMAGDLRGVEFLVQLTGDTRRPLNEAARWNLQSVTEILEPVLNELLCSSCLAWLERKERQFLQWKPVHWYACRVCGKAGRVFAGVEEVVAVLDEDWEEETAERKGILRVNWLRRRTLFDFDRVEIVAAADEEVERFLIAVGNDTDEWRQSRYKHMVCAVARQCALSENTLRILRSTFGEVTRG